MRAQEDLFASEVAASAIDASFPTAKRLALDSHSWIEIVPGWLSGSRALFERLRQAVPWRQHDRLLFDQLVREPRLTAHYRDLDAIPEAILASAVHALSRRYGVAYDGLWLNFYRDGHDSTAWHRD